MSRKTYAFIGHAKISRGLELGVSVCKFDEKTAAMEPVGTFAKELRVGAQAFDASRNVLYVVDEYWAPDGRTGGGGRIAALDFDPESGILTLKNLKQTFAANPSYITLDKTGSFLLVSHHCTDRFVTRIVETDNGFRAEVLYDRCVLQLWSVAEDGSIAELLDFVDVPGNDLEGEHAFPHLHCVIPDRQRNYFMVCDKGLDKIYSFGIDYEQKKLFKADEFEAAPHTDPRYGVFHPTKPIFYSNCEAAPDIHILKEDEADGTLTPIGSAKCVEDLEKPYEPSDIVIHPSGKYLYVSIRTKNLISVLEVSEDGTRLEPKQTLSCEGSNPRGLFVTADGLFLLAANMQTAAVNGFAIADDGTLSHIGVLAEGGYPGNIQVLSFECED